MHFETKNCEESTFLSVLMSSSLDCKTPQDLPPQKKWASSCQPEDTRTKLNFLYDDLHFGRDEADFEADPFLCEIHWFPIRDMQFYEKYWEWRIFYWEICGLTAVLLSAFMVSQASIPSVDKDNEPESIVELESMDKKRQPSGQMGIWQFKPMMEIY